MHENKVFSGCQSRIHVHKILIGSSTMAIYLNASAFDKIRTSVPFPLIKMIYITGHFYLECRRVKYCDRTIITK